MRAVLYFAGVASFGLYLLLLSLPVGPDAQVVLGIAGLATMIVIDRLGLKHAGRIVFLTIGLALVVRYIVWRATSTLPPTNEALNFGASLMVFGAELFCFITMLLGLFAVARPVDRKPAPRLPADQAPTVDVFVPTYNEDLEIVAATLAAAKAMRYPDGKLTVYLLDDGGTDQRCESEDEEVAATARKRREVFSRACADLGVIYHARERNVHAKAGNLNGGLGVSKGELVVVFDADHAPSQDFLEETVGYFSKDSRLFLVQTPHFFLNPDPIERNLDTFSSMPSENEMFYGVIQKGLDNWNAAFFCGSAAVLRREALEEVGGFSGVSITEDCETALDLHSRGWNSVYVDKPMIAGLQPETFASFIGQRSRWCRGMIQILLLKNPVFRPGLTLAQRICYLSSSLFWMFPLPRAVFLIAPLLFLFLDMQIYKATLEEFFAYTVIYMGALLLMQSHLYGRVRWPLISELYEYVQSVRLFPAVWTVIFNPRRPKFNVTDKGISVEKNYLSELSLPYYVIFGVLLLGLVVTIGRYVTEPDTRGLILIVGVWNFLNLVIAGLALGVVSERRERRRMPRVSGSKHAAELLYDGVALPVVVTDVSSGGLKIRPNDTVPSGFGTGRQALLRVPVEARVGQPAEVIEVSVYVANAGRTQSGRYYGLKFAGTGQDRFRLVAALLYADLDPLGNSRLKRRIRRFMPLFLIRVIAWSAGQTARGMSYALFHRNPETSDQGAPEKAAKATN
ncbi:UDP-forming cellulose synthase catalytic subunit [Chthonobacter rhizosphaerae]|uniref:UDP-forming cellulose synthase catalytic subunit n=1 Tax=Chthonobacter rhizosphaerae TaxID=2735553 RepID=UPI0015EF6953|nr:UDP-forming cellulose synthase catalytic subunit [Chthonobacter rhizosphaerae]